MSYSVSKGAGENPNAHFTKWVHPKQVAAALPHLASESSLGVNGAGIPIYGRDV